MAPAMTFVCTFGVAVTPSPRTLHAELLRLCARIGYSPPISL
ncbi:capsid protein [Mesorhizobium intechi]|nr:capsid protein [Mesorhizobium intechi]